MMRFGINCAVDVALIIGFILLWYFGLLGFWWLKDTFFLCSAIVGVAAIFFGIGHFTDNETDFGVETVITLGLVGTVIGLMQMLNVPPEDINTRLLGASVAMSTTLTGLLCALVLRYQQRFLRGAK